MIEHLKLFFNDSLQRIAFLSIHSQSLESDLHFGHAELHNPDSQIANKLMQMLFAILMSHKDLALEDGFSIRVVVLSMEHVAAMTKKGIKQVKKETKYLKTFGKKKFGAAGGGDARNAQTVVPKRKYIKIPLEVPTLPKCFDNICLVLALCVGILYHKAYEKEAAGDKMILQQLKDLHCTNSKKKREESASFLLQECHKLVEGFDELALTKGPFTLDQLKPLCMKYKVQICIFSKQHGDRLVYQVPKQANLRFKKVFLYENTLLGEDFISHVDVLLTPPKTECGKVYTACCLELPHNLARHKCERLQKCTLCKRPMLYPEMYFSHLMAPQFCTVKMINTVNKRPMIKDHKMKKTTCPGCKKNFTNKNYFKEHTSFCGEGWSCPKCSARLTAPMGRQKKDMSAALKRKVENHVCDTYTCKGCWTKFPKYQLDRHSCRLQIPRFPSTTPRLNVITTIYS